MDNPGIYIHVPFCLKKCPYCDFYSLSDGDNLHKSFVSSLIHEIIQAGPHYSGSVFDTVYIGGGTPNILDNQSIKTIVSTIRETFRISEDPEITLELNPECVRAEDLRIYKTCGINRLSLGTQSFSNKELNFLGRIHDVEKNIEALTRIRSAGFSSLSCDLIIGLPDQTLEDIQMSLDALKPFSPEHLSVYTLTYEEGTPLYRRMMRDEITPADEEVVSYLWLSVHDILTRQGYDHYEISNYTLPGFRSRHNSKYWDDSNYLGFGPSAHSKWDNRRFWNKAELFQYIKWGPEKEEEVTNLQQMLDEQLMLGLRRCEGFDMRNIPNPPLQKAVHQKVQTLNANFPSPLLQIDDHFLKATPEGWCVLNTLIEKISEELCL